ncbi:site-2 protease family protein [Rothia sp. LK2588]|uniref:RIP metalloprotease n=1 Tax=Rothia sp. LK2588 TaxID=3114369 RepID=UPI0034CD4BD1
MGMLLFVVGVVLMALAIAASIALHEIGHLVPAKLFGVRVPQYMIGFGKTVFSRRRGETEYGIKAIPLGGYISMIGMYPPARGARRPGRLAEIFDEARRADNERITAADEGRLFYQLPVHRRIVIMLGGPLMNLLIGTVCTAILIMGFGSQQPTTTVSEISQCVKKVEAQQEQDSPQSCTAKDRQAPAAQAGLKPGDVITSFNGERVGSWDELTDAIKSRADQRTELTVERDGREQRLTLTPIKTARPIFNDLTGQYEKNADGSLKTEEVGFVGVSPTTELTPGQAQDVLPTVGQNLQQIGATVIKLPARVYGVAETLATNGQRSADSPVSVVGVGRVAGEIAATDRIDLHAKTASLVSLVASMNLMLFVFNLIPLLPLDGGHVVGALWEGVRRTVARLFGRRDPGPFDPVRLLPLTWIVAGSFMLMSLILIVADVVKPITLF